MRAGYLWKDKSEDGVRKILRDQVIPLDRLLVETDAPFMYPNTRASKLPQHVKDRLTEKYPKTPRKNWENPRFKRQISGPKRSFRGTVRSSGTSPALSR